MKVSNISIHHVTSWHASYLTKPKPPKLPIVPNFIQPFQPSQIPHKPPPQMTKHPTSEKSSHPVFLCHVFCSVISFPKCFQVMNLLWQTQQSVVIHLFTERCFSWFTPKPLELGTWRVPLAWTSEGFEKQKPGNFSKKKNGGEGEVFLGIPKRMAGSCLLLNYTSCNFNFFTSDLAHSNMIVF